MYCFLILYFCLVKLCPIITTADFNLFKLLHAVTFKMTLKAENHHILNMQAKVHKVSNMKTVLCSSTAYMFAFYTCFSWTSTWWIPLQEGRTTERWSIPPSRHSLLFHGSLKVYHLNFFKCAFENISGWDRPWLLVNCHANQTSIFVP